MNGIGRLLVMLAIVALAAGCSRHVMSEDSLSAVDLPDGYRQFIQDPPANIGKTVLLGGFIAENILTREGTTLKVKPFTLDQQGQPRRLIQDGEEFLASTDRFLPPDRFGEGHMVTLTATYRGLESREEEGRIYRRMLFEIGEIHSWPPPAHYPYGYRYPYRIY
jgi:starvation-inducible outer membrane lipoprotein